jgi:hypothetical protein
VALHGSISAIPAGWLDGSEFVEVDFDNRLQRLTGSAVAEGLGQRLEPGSTLRLYGKEFTDRVAPALRS